MRRLREELERIERVKESGRRGGGREGEGRGRERRRQLLEGTSDEGDGMDDLSTLAKTNKRKNCFYLHPPFFFSSIYSFYSYFSSTPNLTPKQSSSFQFLNSPLHSLGALSTAPARTAPGSEGGRSLPSLWRSVKRSYSLGSMWASPAGEERVSEGAGGRGKKGVREEERTEFADLCLHLRVGSTGTDGDGCDVFFFVGEGTVRGERGFV